MLGRSKPQDVNVEPAGRWLVEDAITMGVSGKKTLQSAMDKGSKNGWDLRFIVQGANDFVLIVWDTQPATGLKLPAGGLEPEDYQEDRPLFG